VIRKLAGEHDKVKVESVLEGFILLAKDWDVVGTKEHKNVDSESAGMLRRSLITL